MTFVRAATDEQVFDDAIAVWKRHPTDLNWQRVEAARLALCRSGRGEQHFISETGVRHRLTLDGRLVPT